MAVKTIGYKARDYSELIGIEGLGKELLNNHFTLYQGYVTNTNKILETLSETAPDGKDPRFAELNRRLGFEFNGMRLHEYYFDALGGDGKLDRQSAIAGKLSEEFGSFEDWQKQFKAICGMRGIGWAALYHDPNTGRCLNFWINEHHVSHPSSCQLLLVVDVWEHAFMLDYGLNKADYVEAVFRNLNWNVVEQRLQRG